MSQKILRGGWSGIGMATVGIHPTDLELDPTKIPPGGVVQNCPSVFQTIYGDLKQTVTTW